MKRILLSLILLIGILPLTGTTLLPPSETQPPEPTPKTTTFNPSSGDPGQADLAEIEQAIRDELYSHQGDLLVAVLNETKINNFAVSQDDSWATAWLVPVDLNTGEEIPAEPGLAIVLRSASGWQAVLPSDPAWAAAVQAAPEDLLPADQKTTWLELYAEQAEAAAASLEEGPFRGYLLPYAAGTRLVLTRSILHYNPPDPTKNMHYSFDFAAWHDSSGTSPMFPVYASKAGTVKYAVWQHPNGNEKYTNYIVLEDTTTDPTTYQVYLHLAQDSIPPALRVIGASVLQGQYIGLADDTGISSGNHLHFQVHTNPSSYWGKAVDIIFEDVSINGGRPRTIGEAKYFPQYGSQGQVEYLSGNTVRIAPTPPIGGILSPLPGLTVSAGTLQLEGWATDDDSGLRTAQFIAKYDGAWHDVGPEFTSSPFQTEWDLCADLVPDGPVSLALKLSDRAGSQTFDLPGLRHFIKNYACPPPPTCTPGEDQVALYTDADYRGKCELFEVGSYNTVAALGDIGDDNVASVKVGTNARVTLSMDDDFRGRSQTFPPGGSDSSLADDWIGADTVSSLMIQSKSTVPAAPFLTWPGNNASFAANSSISLVWEDGGGGEEFQVVWDGSVRDWQAEPVLHLGSLSPGTYTWKVKARSSAGESVWSSTWTLNITNLSSSTLSPVTAPFSDDMEVETSQWTASSGWSRVTDDNHTPDKTTSWRFTPGSDLSSPSFGDLSSPPIIIPDQEDHYLRFWYTYGTEGPGIHWDQRWLQIAVDDGPYHNILQLAYDPPNVWLQSPAIPLSSYRGHTIRVRFHYETLDAVANEAKGWYIDDFSITQTPPPVCSAAGEPNDSKDTAQGVSLNTSITAHICPGGDVDFYRFTGNAGDQIGVAVDAQTAGSKLDPVVFLLDGDGRSVLASGDDQILYERTDSSLFYRLNHSGDYYIKVQAWDHPSVGGSDYGYTLRMYSEKDSPAGKFLYPSNAGFIADGPILLSVSASDAGSGISHIEFLWHSDDWMSSDWETLGEDWDGQDGWSYPFDSTEISPDAKLSFYARAFDWAGNWFGLGVWDIQKVSKTYFPMVYRNP